jgi:lysylphosphatidylglycerol synthetase-like protein (DUF2156 family)
MYEVVRDCIDEVSACLADHGHQAGGYHVLGPDPWRVVWADRRAAFAAFLEAQHAILGWRSPVGDRTSCDDALAALAAHADEVRKPLFVVLVDEATCLTGIRLGLIPTWIGTESFIDLPEWSIAGGRRQKVRWARNHAVGLGLDWRELHPSSSPADHAAMSLVESAWKTERRERRTDSFQRTSFTELIETRRYFGCVDADRVLAFCACTPASSTTWYLQDIVRVPDAPRGALEGAMALALDVLRDEGFVSASNGPIPFWRPDGAPADTHALGPVGHRIVSFFDRQYRFGGISQFRNKFVADRTEPLYVLRNRRAIGPFAAASLVRLLTKRAPKID